VSKLTYELLHWGTPAKYVEKLYVPEGSGTPTIQLEAISYVTVKEGDPTVYRHDFGKKQGRFPYLLVAGSRATKDMVPFPTPGKNLIALGRVIDFETVDENGNKGRIYTPFLWVVTTMADKKKGGPVLLASRFRPAYAIEHRDGDPHIIEHGIIN
jgi:hypothetical protein